MRLTLGIAVLGLATYCNTLSSPNSASTAAAPTIDLARYPRPETGEQIIPASGVGRGDLTIENGTARDATVKLERGAAVYCLVYIRAGESATVTDIPEGAYRVLFSTGAKWSFPMRRFEAGPSYQRFDQSMVYQEVQKWDGVEYSRFTLTLHPVPGGKATTTGISESEFLRGM
jgi:hypothetical protein